MAIRSARNEVISGLFVIAGVIAVTVALFLLTDPGTLRGRYHVNTQVRDAGGIRKGDPVQMRGVNVGRIRGFRMQEDGVQVSLELENEYPVPRDSRVELRSLGLLGGMVADIKPGGSTERLKEGDVLPATTGGGGGGLDLAALGGRADTIMARAEMLLSRQTIGHVGASAAELQETMTQLAGLATEQRRQIAALTASLNSTAASANRSARGVEAAATRPELVRAVARTDSITRKLDEATAALRTASASVAALTGRMDRGEGTIGKLSRDDSLYVNLNRAVTNLSTLSEEIRRDPKKFLNVSVF